MFDEDARPSDRGARGHLARRELRQDRTVLLPADRPERRGAARPGSREADRGYQRADGGGGTGRRNDRHGHDPGRLGPDGEEDAAREGAGGSAQETPLGRGDAPGSVFLERVQLPQAALVLPRERRRLRKLI